MRLILASAVFSGDKGIGTMNSWFITYSRPSGLTWTQSPFSVTKGGPLTAKATLNTVSYELTTISVEMGGNTQTGEGTSNGITISKSGSEYTISITAVNANVNVTVVTQAIAATPSNYTLTINPTPTDATVTLTASGYSQSGNSITVANGTSVSWGVSKSGYTEQTGTWIANGGNETKSVTLTAAGGTPVTPTNYTFTINPDPTSATVTLSATGYSTVSGTGSQNITVTNGTEVNWSVSASGYTTRTGNWTISGGNKTENITLSEEGDTNFVNPRLSHPQINADASVPSDGIITQDMTIVLEDCWMNGTYSYLSWNPEGSGGESSGIYTDDYFYCYLPVDISGYTKIDITANNDNAAYYQFFTKDLSFTTTGGRIKVDKGTTVTAQTIPAGAKYLLIAHHRIKEGAYSDYYPTTVKLYQ